MHPLLKLKVEKAILNRAHPRRNYVWDCSLGLHFCGPECFGSKLSDLRYSSFEFV